MTVEPRWLLGTPVPEPPQVMFAAPILGPAVPSASVAIPNLWIAATTGSGPWPMRDACVVVSAAEISALVGDGTLVPVLGPVHIAAGCAQSREVKAAALSMCLPFSVREHAVLHRSSAAWMHCCAEAPTVVEFITHRDNRCSTRPAPPAATVRWSVRQLLYEPQDVDHFYGLRATTPLRTAADLACCSDSRAEQALSLMLRAPHLGVDGEQVVRLLRSRPRLPHRTRGVATVRRLCRRLDLPVPSPSLR